MCPVQTSAKIPSGTPEHKQHPHIETPGLLRLVAGLSILSVTGVMVYAVFLGLSGFGASGHILSASEGIYVAILHLVLPIGVTYTVMMNFAASRILITVYTVTLGIATISGNGALAAIAENDTATAISAMAVMSAIIYWLYRSPTMRFYYALISGRPIPTDLRHRAEELAARRWINPRVKATIDWVADRLETVVLLGFAVVAVIAYFQAANF